MTRLFSALSGLALMGLAALPLAASAQDYTVRVPVLAATHAPLTTNFDFGTVIVGTQPSRAFNFTNRSAKPTTLGAVQAIGKARVLEHNCTGILQPNETCSLTLALVADALGSNTGSVSVSHSEASTPDLYNLSATAVTSSVAIRFDEPVVNFGSQLLRTASDARTLTLRNVGSEDAQLTSVQFAKSTTHYLLQDNTCEGTLPAGGTCQVSVVFRPQSLGALSASLSYTLEDGTVVNAASLLGSGVQGIPTWSASEVNFLDVAAGQESAPKSVTLTNTGLGTLGLTSLTLLDSSGESQYFWISSTTCGGSLLPGASCQVSIVFSAPDTAIRNAVLELRATGTTSPLTRVQVWARPVANEALLSLDPVSLAFGDVAVGQPKTLPLTLRSVGQAPVSVSAYAFSGANAADFTLVNPTECVGTLNPGMQCVVQVRVTPGAAGARVGTLTLTHTANQPVSPVALSANGLLGELQVMPASLTFSPTVKGATSTQTLQLKNVGGASLRVASLSIASAQTGAAAMFSAGSTCTGLDLAAGASCAFTVAYAPTVAGTQAATLTINHTGLGTQKAVPLNGTGTEPAPSLLALTDFVCPSPAQSGVLTVCGATLSNPSTVPVTLSGLGSSSNTSFVPGLQGCSSGATLNPGQTCAVQLSATFSAVGTYTTTYQLSSTAPTLTKTISLVVQAPVATLTTTSHGNVQIGSSATATHKLVNSGSLPVSLTMPATLAATGSTAFTVVSHTCPATLATGTSCDIVTRCTPTTTGTLTRGLNVASNASPAISGMLTCEGLNSDANSGLLTLSPNPLTFATTAVDSTTAATTVTVRNNNAVGAKAVAISGVTFSGTQASAFAVTASTCYSGATPGSLASGATCTLTLTARPSAAGLNSGVLQLTTDLTGAAPQLAMSVTGAQAAFTISPLTQDFGSITAGAAVASRTYTVTNTGSAAGSLTSVLAATGSSPIFAFSHNCPASIAAGASCAVTVAINSTASATRTGAQTGSASVQFSQGPSITVNALANIQPAPVPAGTVSISCPATAPLGAAFTCTARVTSTGTANLAVSSWAPAYQVDGAAWTNLTAGTVTCSSTGASIGAIPPGQYCSTTLTVTPSVTGTYTLRTVPTGSATLAPATATVTVQGPSLQLTTTNHPTTQVGASSTVSHTLTNNGPVSVTISAGTSSVAAITVNRSACTTLAPGQSCAVSTTCSPTVAGVLSASLTLSGSPTVSTSGTVTCTGQTGSASISPDTNATTLAGGFTTSGSWTRLTNTGVGPVTIQAFYPATGWALVGNPALTSDCVVGKVLQASESCVFLESLTGAQGPNTTNTGTQRVRTSVGDSSWTSQPLVLKGLSFTPVTPFGTVQVGDNVTAVYSVTNQAPTPTAMSTTFAVTGTGLSVDSHTCPATLASGATCQVTLRLAAPASATTVSGTLSASTGYNALVSNQVQAGTARSGVQGSLSLSIPILAANATLTAGTNSPIAVGQSVDITHELRNDGSAPVRITSAATLSSTTQHTLVGGTCTVGASVAPGATCTVVTRFAPTVAAQGAVTLTLGTSVGTRTASFTGRVLVASEVSVALTGPSSVLSSGTGTYTLTVTNGAGGPARVVVSFGSTNSSGAQAYLSLLTGNICGTWSMTEQGSATQTAAPTASTTGVTCTPRVDLKQLELYIPASRNYSASLNLSAGSSQGSVTVSSSIAISEVQDTNAANNSASVTTAIVGGVVAWTPNKACGGSWASAGAPAVIDSFGRVQCNNLISDYYRGLPTGTTGDYNMFFEDPDYPSFTQNYSARASFKWPVLGTLAGNPSYGSYIDVGADGMVYLNAFMAGTADANRHWVLLFDRFGTLQRKYLVGPSSINSHVPAAADSVRGISYVVMDWGYANATLHAIDMQSGTLVRKTLMSEIPYKPRGVPLVDEVSGELVFVETLYSKNDTVVRYNPATRTSTRQTYAKSLFVDNAGTLVTRVRGNRMFHADAPVGYTTVELRRINLTTGDIEVVAKGTKPSTSSNAAYTLYPGADGVYQRTFGVKMLWNY